MGTGLVVGRREGAWSAPAAIALAGVGWGFQVGGAVSDILIVLRNRCLPLLPSRHRSSSWKMKRVRVGITRRVDCVEKVFCCRHSKTAVYAEMNCWILQKAHLKHFTFKAQIASIAETAVPAHVHSLELYLRQLLALHLRNSQAITVSSIFCTLRTSISFMTFMRACCHRQALHAFCGKVHLGGGVGASLALGPMGRQAEAALRVGTQGGGVCYSYSCSSGVFAGKTGALPIVVQGMGMQLLGCAYFV